MSDRSWDDTLAYTIHERRRHFVRLLEPQLPSWYEDDVLPPGPRDGGTNPKPPRWSPQIELDVDGELEYLPSSAESSWTVPAHELSPRQLYMRPDEVYVALPEGYVRAPARFHLVFVDPNGIGKVRQQCWCTTMFDTDLSYRVRECCPSHKRPHEYHCQRCGTLTNVSRPAVYSDDSSSTFCSTYCRESRDGVSLLAVRDVFRDLCIVCGDGLDDSSATMFSVEPIKPEHAHRISLLRPCHRTCLESRPEVLGLEHQAADVVSDSVRAAFHGSLSRFNELAPTGDLVGAVTLLQEILAVVPEAMQADEVILARSRPLPSTTQVVAVSVTALAEDPELDRRVAELHDLGVLTQLAPEAVTRMRTTMKEIMAKLSDRPHDTQELGADFKGRRREYTRAVQYLQKVGLIHERPDSGLLALRPLA